MNSLPRRQICLALLHRYLDHEFHCGGAKHVHAQPGDTFGRLKVISIEHEESHWYIALQLQNADEKGELYRILTYSLFNSDQDREHNHAVACIRTDRKNKQDTWHFQAV